MKNLLKQAKTATEFKRVQSVLLGAGGISSLRIAVLAGLSPEYIRDVWRQYRKQGARFLLGERRGQARGKARLSLQEEENFLQPFFTKAKQAGILIVSEVKKAYEKKHERKVHHSVIYNLLHRHGWRKIVPRPSHPKADTKVQDKFRRTFPPEDNQG